MIGKFPDSRLFETYTDTLVSSWLDATITKIEETYSDSIKCEPEAIARLATIKSQLIAIRKSFPTTYLDNLFPNTNSTFLDVIDVFKKENAELFSNPIDINKLLLKLQSELVNSFFEVARNTTSHEPSNNGFDLVIRTFHYMERRYPDQITVLLKIKKIIEKMPKNLQIDTIKLVRLKFLAENDSGGVLISNLEEFHIYVLSNADCNKI
jgi:hypothetical protein